MKKSLFLVGLLSASTMFAETQFFVGAGFDRTDTDAKASSGAVSISDSIKANGYKIKAGVIVDDNYRTSISYSGYSKNGDDVKLGLLNFDYLIALPYEKTKLILGAHAGMSKYDEDTNTVKDTAFSYGLQTGVLYDITSNVSFEVNLAYTRLNLEDNVVISGVPVKAELEDAMTMGFGINYKF